MKTIYSLLILQVCLFAACSSPQSFKTGFKHFENRDYATAKAKVLEGFEQRFLTSVLARARGNVTAAARLAGTERRYLGKLLKKRGLDKTADPA